jgi:SNF2 family DNA or RNA helicase
VARLEDLTQGAAISGILPDEIVTVVSAQWIGSEIIDLTYKDASGRLSNELVYRDREPQLSVAEKGRPWSFDGDGGLLRLVSEAYRINLAYLFDPVLAVHTSMVDPLPHQITAVYEEMLPRQPLRYLLADDPGSGKTIMTGLLIKELLVRGDLHRCLIVCPGSLVEQWQDELSQRFGLDFDIITREKIESSRSGNPFVENNLVIGRLDHLSRNEDVQARLMQTDWDLIVCDEAHKMSASFFSGEIKETKRYKLGKMLAGLCRHFLLLSATPHNGKEEDFQLFMALLDGDRFEGKFRDGVHQTDTSDLMRRLIKEDLRKFDGRPLFPERLAYSVNYTLSNDEAALYAQVTEYVQEEMNRADRLAREGQGRRGNNVGFALTILQRRLASSPEAIYQSLQRRRNRLGKRLREEQFQKRGLDVASALPESERYSSGAYLGQQDALRTIREDDPGYLSDEDIEDLEDAPESEIERAEAEIADKATAARTIVELQAEIRSLERLENLALRVRQSGTDRKWEELSRLLQDREEMFDPNGHRRKLIIFTEHRDTINYLRDRIGSLLGRPEAVVVIHGGLGREERRKAQEEFTQNPDVQVLLATDAAGEGVNLQRAHLMVNYDLPWNPNRIEQRFGRIHRIGQTEVCHLWNLVAAGTREGEVFLRLFEKLEEERKALGGKVFDVLGKVFGDQPLRELLIEAIRYGNAPETRERLNQRIDAALDRKHIQELLEERALTRDTMDSSKIMEVKEEMERAEARRLQPHFIGAFFVEAFKLLGGTMREREPGRYEISHVPALIRSRDRQIGRGVSVLSKYERIAFDKELVAIPGKPLAAFVCPGHGLLDAVIDITLEQHRGLLKRGAILVDPDDPGTDPRALVYLEHSVQDARIDRAGNRRVVSKRVEFVELTPQGTAREAGPAPYLDYRPIEPDERSAIEGDLQQEWLSGALEMKAIQYAAWKLVPDHLRDVRDRREELVQRIKVAVKERLTKEITYWDNRATQLKLQELAGRQPRLNSENAKRRRDDLAERLQRRMEELEQERQVSPQSPVVMGGALVVPIGLLNLRLGREDGPEVAADAQARAEVERLAMEAVIEAERVLGREPKDVSARKIGYDIESKVAEDGRLVFIEVKGRKLGASTVTLTKQEILTGLNTPDNFVLALVEVDGTAREPRYVRRPPFREPVFPEVSVTYDLKELLARAEVPS